MKKKSQKNCLILNKSWTACNLATIRRAVGLALKERGKIIHPITLNMYTFDDWIDKGVERPEHERLRYRDIQYDIPTIVCAIYYDDLHLKFTPLNHQNIYMRDGFKCVYCGSKKNLTWDHIVPECRGGRTNWLNLVTSCKECNNQKDDLSVEEFCQIKQCEIPKPISLATTPWLLGKANLRTEWKYFLKGG